MLTPLVLPGVIDPLDVRASNATKESLRRDEIVECLRKNLRNPIVATITVIHLDAKLPVYLKPLQLYKAHKLVLFNQTQKNVNKKSLHVFMTYHLERPLDVFYAYFLNTRLLRTSFRRL